MWFLWIIVALLAIPLVGLLGLMAAYLGIVALGWFAEVISGKGHET